MGQRNQSEMQLLYLFYTIQYHCSCVCVFWVVCAMRTYPTDEHDTYTYTHLHLHIRKRWRGAEAENKQMDEVDEHKFIERIWLGWWHVKIEMGGVACNATLQRLCFHCTYKRNTCVKTLRTNTANEMDIINRQARRWKLHSYMYIYININIERDGWRDAWRKRE